MVDGINTNRITGLASGIDTEKMVEDLMKAERMPLNKMKEDQTWMTWKRDAYRDINKSFSELDNKILDMKLEKTFNAKATTSTQSDAVTATATAGSSSGVYNIEVKSLASAAMNYSESAIASDGEKIDINAALSEQNFAGKDPFKNGNEQSFKFYTYNKNNDKETHEVIFNGQDSLKDVLNRISEVSNGAVKAFYDQKADKVILERTESGNFNQSDKFSGAEIGFDEDVDKYNFLTDTLNIRKKNESGGTNAEFTYNNGYDVESTSNSYTLDGVTFQFTDTTNGSSATVSVTNDIDAAVEKITGFVDKYNELIDKINGKLQEERYRDYQPLTDKQKDEMSENEIKLWEEKAKSGLLRGDNTLSSAVFDMRRNWYAQVDNASEFSHLSEIGIKTTSNYLDGGKLTISEDKLREALRENPDSVHKFFSNDVQGDGRGIINRLEDSINRTMNNIEERAGKGGQTLEQYTLGKELKNINSRINTFEDRLVRVEDRYWRQFTQMEKAIQQMNSQSNFLMQQFGG
ncbi:flagellar hook-associated protein 2 [Lentibacillus lipolyticus]|nr:flagellar hook-associated protein 2 [Lentibacillus lipolyticus]